MRRRPTLLVAAASVLGLSAACSDRTDRVEVDAPTAVACLQRATDRSAMAHESIGLRPFVSDGASLFGDDSVRRSIDGDPRVVLPGVASREVSFPGPIALPPEDDRPVGWRIPIRRQRFPGVDRFVVAPRAGIAGVGLRPLESVTRRLQEDDRGAFVEVELDLAGLPTGRGEATVAATLLAAPRSAESVYQTAPFTLPDGPVWLEYGIGILEPGVEHGPVQFRIEHCQADGCACIQEETLEPSDPDGRGWRDRAIPLDGSSQSPQSLRFTARALGLPGADVPTLLAEWARPRLVVAGDTGSSTEPNLIVVSLDTLRADHLGVYGYPRQTSPFVSDTLARRASVFEQAIAPATATGPSHMTMFTGLSPSVHGVMSNLSADPLPSRIETLAERLREHGFVTGSVNENGALSRRMGFDRGFDYHRQFFGANLMKPKGFVADVFDEGLAFLARHPGQRFFLFLHTYEVHSPYAPPKRFEAFFREGDDPDHPDNQRVGRRRRNLYPVRYDREIRHVDHELERLVESLEAGGWLDDTILVITSDHGEAFGEHGTFGHGADVYQETVRVPLLVMGPGVPTGSRIELPVGLIDLMPTLLELVGAPVPGGLMGRSFAGLLSSDEPADESVRDRIDRTIVSEAWAHSKSATGKGVETRRTHAAYRRGRFKLIRSWSADAVHEELYDIDQDPLEERNLLADDVVTSDTIARAADTLRATADAHSALESEVGARHATGRPPFPEPSASEMSPERLEALRMLGYIE